MEAPTKPRKRKARRIRKPQPKRHFQASFLYRRDSEVTSPPPANAEEQEAFIREVVSQVRLRSPPPPIDFRGRLARVPEELTLNSRLVRRTLSQPGLAASKGVTRPNTAEEQGGRPPVAKPSFFISGLSAPVAEKKEVRQRPSSSNSQSYFRYERLKKVSVSDISHSERLQVKYFNSDIIPKKPERTFTLADIQKYLQYIGTKPFR